jgi:hypothetical protein
MDLLIYSAAINCVSAFGTVDPENEHVVRIRRCAVYVMIMNGSSYRHPGLTASYFC